MAFILEFIPNIGSVIATLLPMPLVLLDPNVSWLKMILTFVLPALVHVRISIVNDVTQKPTCLKILFSSY